MYLQVISVSLGPGDLRVLRAAASQRHQPSSQIKSSPVQFSFGSLLCQCALQPVAAFSASCLRGSRQLRAAVTQLGSHSVVLVGPALQSAHRPDCSIIAFQKVRYGHQVTAVPWAQSHTTIRSLPSRPSGLFRRPSGHLRPSGHCPSTIRSLSGPSACPCELLISSCFASS